MRPLQRSSRVGRHPQRCGWSRKALPEVWEDLGGHAGGMDGVEGPTSGLRGVGRPSRRSKRVRRPS